MQKREQKEGEAKGIRDCFHVVVVFHAQANTHAEKFRAPASDRVEKKNKRGMKHNKQQYTFFDACNSMKRRTFLLLPRTKSDCIHHDDGKDYGDEESRTTTGRVGGFALSCCCSCIQSIRVRLESPEEMRIKVFIPLCLVNKMET